MRKIQGDIEVGRSAAIPEIFSKKVSIGSFNLEAQAKFSKNGVVIEGKYYENNFKIELVTNGNAFLSYNKQLDKYPVTAATFQRTKEIIWGTGTNEKKIKSIVAELWSNIEKNLHEVSMSNTKLNYNQVGKVEVYLNRMINFYLDIRSAKISISDDNSESLFSKMSNAFRKS